MPAIRDEVLRSQLRPVLALALAAAALIAMLIVAQYAWLRLQDGNPLDEINVEDLRQVLRTATPEQWPVLMRWVAAFGLGMTVEDAGAVPPGQARLPDGTQVALSDVLCVVIGGQRVDAANGQPLGPAPAAWRAAMEQLSDRNTLRLAPAGSGDAAMPQGWPVVLFRLDAQRVAALASPNYAIAARDLAELVLKAFVLTSAAVAGFVSLFLFVFRRRFAARSAARLSAPVERLAETVRLAARERDASRRAVVEAPAEVAQLAADFNRLQEHLTEALAERGRVIDGQRDLVASLSHELRTPLAVLRGHAEVLSREEGSASRALVMLRQIEDLHSLLSDLLDMARLESIEAALVLRDVPLEAVVLEMIERFSASAWRQGVLLRPAHTPLPSLPVRADPRWLRQIVANLLSNAIRHTPPGGLVTLDIKRRGEKVQLVIEDSGTGIDADRARHDATSRSAGIGLRVVQRLAVAMRGSLLMEPTDDGGTRASVELCLSEAATASLPPG
ncbi:MAG: sensor histidine kinase [Betaproteobacteria bacterium]|jgi:signal transduction histidine kinase|nr:HAMP domain-containing histidine kinase [Rhodocyclaceae bacterium]MCA3135823.1 HAMP domain-containing histidine kinase [Rhodocyclaceae bacterium]MCA3140870.1 HAMP domain-containing histidine kinase [Rhodocyclaceae bacterium]MCA3147363.1 HAMP domain-containing histidine kinase [Rhodocyclaceae bacterium]MCE2897176.1 HAMP domain-containing histidine kinase [Betaproteobacteria bacterium]